MREIKFRGKRVDNGEWVYGYLFEGILGSFILPFEFAFPSNSMNTDLVEIIPETVGEFTGLTDKNNKEIYEGDILDNKFNAKGSVFYKGGMFVCKMVYKDSVCPEDNQEIFFRLINIYTITEIIGNIYENPELLK